MSLPLYILVGAVIALFGAYIMSFQSVTLHWGRILAGEKSLDQLAEESIENQGHVDNEALARQSISNRGFQDAITPPSLTKLVLLLFAALIIFSIYGWITFSWLYGILGFVGSFIVIQIFKRFFPPHFSDYWKHKIINSLNVRKLKYENSGDLQKLEAIAHFQDLMERT